MNNIEIINECDCIVDYDLLEKAILKFKGHKPLFKVRIYGLNGDPAVLINKKLFRVKHLILQYSLGRKLKKNEVVRHIDFDRLNCSLENLKIGDKITIHDSKPIKFRMFNDEYNKLQTWKKNNNIRTDEGAVMKALEIAYKEE